ncbi:hypothetical protein ACFWBB_09975 [Streptomyces sp. NPDC060000]|uniref:hypothetical protein n=1 Tax=Streptomyces sp. NPDC060000 TaxID=3347031 RepID=UPI00367D4135
MNAVQLWKRVRRADKPTAVIVGMGNLLLCGMLLLMLIGGTLIFEATTREQETAAQRLAGQIFGYWLVGGLMLFSVLGMTRALFSHLATMFLPPVVLILILAFLM